MKRNDYNPIRPFKVAALVYKMCFYNVYHYFYLYNLFDVFFSISFVS